MVELDVIRSISYVIEKVKLLDLKKFFNLRLTKLIVVTLRAVSTALLF